jgi:hypothetical protein
MAVLFRDEGNYTQAPPAIQEFKLNKVPIKQNPRFCAPAQPPNVGPALYAGPGST